jgi:cellulose synthase/poly-beta-1,6-N-acetylglucosamine synthase-like glycosyltransferase
MIDWILLGASGLWIGFAHLGYPLALWWLVRASPRPTRRGAGHPPLSLIITVHDGEAEIGRKLDSSLSLVYPGPREIIVASDASTDATDRIAAAFASRGVRLVRQEPRAGKEAAQAAAIGRAKGEILVFSDVGAELEPEALVHLVTPFADPSVGCVSSEDVVSGGGEGAYVRYEMWLRRLESRATSLVGLSGSCFAVRRELCSPWPADLASDFRIALECAARGLRAVSEPAARVRIRTTRAPEEEWPRKVRTVRRGLAVLSAYRHLLSPRRGRIAFSLWGHKVTRFTEPFALLLFLVASASLSVESVWARALVVAQLAAYGVGAAALLHRPLGRILLARLSGFFVLVNLCILAAWLRHLSGARAVVWSPTRR